MSLLFAAVHRASIRLMALAIRFDGLIQEGVVTDQAEIARLGFVTRARVTQIMNLLNLAPEIQEELLFLPEVKEGRDPVTEREVRAVAAERDWGRQRQAWVRMRRLIDRRNLTGRSHPKSILVPAPPRETVQRSATAFVS